MPVRAVGHLSLNQSSLWGKRDSWSLAWKQPGNMGDSTPPCAAFPIFGAVPQGESPEQLIYEEYQESCSRGFHLPSGLGTVSCGVGKRSNTWQYNLFPLIGCIDNKYWCFERSIIWRNRSIQTYCNIYRQMCYHYVFVPLRLEHSWGKSSSFH